MHLIYTIVAESTFGFNSDRTAQQHAHGLLLQSPFVYNLVPIAGLYGQNKAKTAISVAVEAKPEVEIWRRPKKSKEH